MVAGVAGLVAGQCRWLPVSTCRSARRPIPRQADARRCERAELEADDPGEQRELAAIYVGRGLDPALAKQVAAATDGP